MSLDTPGTTPPRRRSLLRRVSRGILKWGAVLLVAVVLVTAVAALNLLGIDRVAFALTEGHTISAISGARGTMPTMARNTAALQSQLSPFFDQIRRDARPFGALPLVVLTAGRMSPIPGFSPDEMRSFRDAWRALHQDIAGRSTNSHWIIAEKSAHYIQRDEPELVTAAVKEVVDGVRDAAVPLSPEAPAVRPVAPARPTAH